MIFILTKHSFETDEEGVEPPFFHPPNMRDLLDENTSVTASVITHMMTHFAHTI